MKLKKLKNVRNRVDVPNPVKVHVLKVGLLLSASYMPAVYAMYTSAAVYNMICNVESGALVDTDAFSSNSY